MSGRTHAVVPAGLVAIFSQGDPTLSLAAAIGGLVPDIDEPYSVIGQRLWFLAFWMKFCFGHRTVSHSLLTVILLLLVGLLCLIPPVLVMAFCVGWGSHLILDALSGGIQLWWPSKDRWVLARYPIYGAVDQACLLVGAVLFVVGTWGRIGTTVSTLPLGGESSRTSATQVLGDGSGHDR